MTEINQLERAKLALKQDPPLRVEYLWRVGPQPSQWYGVVDIDLFLSNCGGNDVVFRVHPDDEAKLDAIIWEGVESQYKYAYVRTKDGLLNHWNEPISNHSVAERWKLIATREPPADTFNPWEKAKDTDDIIIQLSGEARTSLYNKAIYHKEGLEKAGWKILQTRELPAEKPEREYVLGMTEAEAEKAQLVADLKEFVGKLNELTGDHAFYKNDLKSLLARINPKPKRCSSQLPVDTLCEVWMDGNTTMQRFSNGVGGFFKSGTTLETNTTGSGAWDYFKVLKQPKPTFWQGGECPVPDWVEVKLFFRGGNSSLYPQDYSMEGMRNEQWAHKRNPSDVIAYQIMGEKDE